MILKGFAEVAADQILQPQRILHRKRTIKAILMADELLYLRIERPAVSGFLAALLKVPFHRVAGRQVRDRKQNSRDSKPKKFFTICQSVREADVFRCSPVASPYT